MTVIAAHAAWIPQVACGEEGRQEWTFGVGAGIFVPFFDFN